MARIRQLSDAVIGQIAAGEVVERPASVVKELVENALDAGAHAIDLELESGGKRRIRVADDGSGMERDDSLLAFDRHATSKIATAADLERIASFGFRGEALSTIAAVARVDLATAERDGDGHRVRIEGGRVLSAEPAARARGTTVEVADLFFNVPARRKFLKSTETELRRAVEVVEGYALARPDVRWRLRHDGRMLVDAAPASDDETGLRARIQEMFGRATAADLAPVIGSLGLAGEGAARAWGFVGSPKTAGRGRRSYVFVNRRLVRDRAVLAAFYRAVREEWRSDEFPSLFLFLDLPAHEVDVNVHPQKAEVRFRDPRIADRLAVVLREALARARGEVEAPIRLADPRLVARAPLGWEAVAADGHGPSGASEVREGAGVGAAALATAVPIGTGVWSQRPLERAPVPLSGRGGPARPFRLLGQYKGSLILLEGPDGLYLIDQHVAHERVLYERLRAALAAEEVPRQRLVVPLVAELAPSDRLRLLELAEALESAGFEVASLSGGAIGLAAAPAALSPDEALRWLAELATDRAATPENVRRRLLDDWAAAFACKAAIKMHHVLTPEASEALVGELFRAENPFACPHGRPVVLVLSDADLERRFGRR